MEKKNLNKYNDDEVEIDLLELLMALWHRMWLIILAAVLFGGGAGAFSKFVLTPQYTSTAMMYILSKETTLTSLADLQIGSQLTKDYMIVATSRPVLEEIISEQGLDLTYERLKNKITITNPADTRILSITVQDPDPYLAKTLADSVATTSSEYIGEIMEMVPPKIIEKGVAATTKTSPSNGKNAMLGALLGICLVCGIIVLEVLMNDSIKTEEDIERYLDISVLASVPSRTGDSGRHGVYGGDSYCRAVRKQKNTVKKNKTSRRKGG